MEQKKVLTAQEIAKFKFELSNRNLPNISVIKNLNIGNCTSDTIISTYLTKSVLLLSSKNDTKNETDISLEEEYFNQKCADYSCLPDAPTEIVDNLYYQLETCGEEDLDIYKDNSSISHIISLSEKIYENKFSDDVGAILSLHDLDNSSIIIDYIEKKLSIISHDNENEEEIRRINNIFNEKYKCNNKKENITKFTCKIDYLLLGHEDLPQDDVYLAKKINDDSIAYLDNLLSYSIFPYQYIEYFLTSFFSELNDGCEPHKLKDQELYYISCPRKKIEIYTKRRKLSVIINKLSYRIENLFNETFSLIPVNDDSLYYFNLLFTKESDDFILGNAFFINKKIGYLFNDSTYISYSKSDNYTEDLSDDNSDQFEKWLYLLTCGSFSLLLIIFAILGLFHTRKVKKELNEMLKPKI